MVISTSGYYCTGSSAAFNLLEEYESCTAGKLKNWAGRKRTDAGKTGILRGNVVIFGQRGRSDDGHRRYWLWQYGENAA